MTKSYLNASMVAALERAIDKLATDYDIYEYTGDDMAVTLAHSGVGFVIFPEKPALVTAPEGMSDDQHYTAICKHDVTLEAGNIIEKGTIRYRVSQVEDWGDFYQCRLVETAVESTVGS